MITNEQKRSIEDRGEHLANWMRSRRSREEIASELFSVEGGIVYCMNKAGEVEAWRYTDRGEPVEGVTWGVVFADSAGQRLEVGGFITADSAHAFALRMRGQFIDPLAFLPNAEWMDEKDGAGVITGAEVWNYGVISGTLSTEEIY